jgi:predicted nucleotidyltransferase
VSLGAVLRELGAAFDDAEIRWMVAGSVASATWGEVRATQDIDIVVEATRTSLVRLCRALPAERWYADVDMAIEAAKQRSMFNLVDMETGWKVDVILRKGRDFSRAEFERRRRAPVDGVDTWIASPEDVLLAKLEWAQATGSTRQLRDAAGIVAVQGDALDGAWLRRWAKELGVEAELATVYPGPASR